MTFYQKYNWLAPMQLFIAALLAARMLRTHTLVFAFIPWNLSLAIVPLYFSYKLSLSRTRLRQLACFAMWLAFFPNAMYIITDMFHLRARRGVPEWYDLLILFSAAINGVIMGFLSLQNVEHYLQQQLRRKYLPPIMLSLFMLCGYGIYLGRYLRWNSWDIVTNPLDLVLDMRQHIIHPFHHPQCWLLTILFGAWLHICYTYFKKIRSNHYLNTPSPHP